MRNMTSDTKYHCYEVHIMTIFGNNHHKLHHNHRNLQTSLNKWRNEMGEHKKNENSRCWYGICFLNPLLSSWTELQLIFNFSSMQASREGRKVIWSLH